MDDGDEHEPLLAQNRNETTIQVTPASDNDNNDSPIHRLLAANLGTILEWYDFSLFGFFAYELGQTFFPSSDSSALIKSFAIFSGAFIMRPVGGVLFGHLGDMWSRKLAVTLSTFMMAACTFAMGCLPTYAQIGYLAPVLLTLLRLLQGLSVGGQLVGVMVYTVESAPGASRGVYSSITLGMSLFGSALGSIVVTIMHAVASPTSLQAYAWRIPFLLGVLVGAAAIYLQRRMGESPVFEKMKTEMDLASVQSPAARVVKEQSWHILIVSIITALWAAAYYIGFIWMPVYLSRLRTPTPLPSTSAFVVNSIVSVLLCALVMPGFGRIHDRVLSSVPGVQFNIMFGGAGGVLLLAPPVMLAMATGSLANVAVAQSLYCVPLGAFGSVLPLTMCQTFIPSHRVSGIGIAYNLAHAAFGGTAPLLASLLVEDFHSTLYVGIYVSAIAVCAIVALSRLQSSFTAHLKD